MGGVAVLVLLLFGYVHGSLKLASYYNDHMVLQRGPQRAVLWGTADTEGDTVTAKVTGQGSAVTATVQQGVWKLKLPAITDPGPFVIDVTSADGHVTLHDVLFGDVWLCSGQSNMQFNMGQVDNSTAEIQRGLSFSNIRYLSSQRTKSSTPLSSLPVDQKWTRPTADSLKQFSAVCFLFAEYIQPYLKYPIGLVGSYWGGTTIEAWSPPEAIHDCPHVDYPNANPCCPHEATVLWNSKIRPLRPMTIKGALWYQGEANSGHPSEYQCQTKAMLREWRAQFHRESMGETPQDFPFGYAQLGPLGDVKWVGGYMAIRWAQTASHGYSPNPDLPNTFMAVTMDLPDFHSPYGAVHYRHKQDVAHRLVLGALHVAYGNTSVVFQGPFPTHFTPDSAHHQLLITYDGGHAHLDVRDNLGFEVCCDHYGHNCDPFDEHSYQIDAPVIHHTETEITLDTSGCHGHRPTAARYAWRTSPCPLRSCHIYDAVTGLPAPPFFLDIQSGASPIG